MVHKLIHVLKISGILDEMGLQTFYLFFQRAIPEKLKELFERSQCRRLNSRILIVIHLSNLDDVCYMCETLRVFRGSNNPNAN